MIPWLCEFPFWEVWGKPFPVVLFVFMFSLCQLENLQDPHNFGPSYSPQIHKTNLPISFQTIWTPKAVSARKPQIFSAWFVQCPKNTTVLDLNFRISIGSLDIAIVFQDASAMSHEDLRGHWWWRPPGTSHPTGHCRTCLGPKRPTWHEANQPVGKNWKSTVRPFFWIWNLFLAKIPTHPG